MFWKHWEPAIGVVIDARFTGNPGHSNSQQREFVVEVRAVTGEVFRAQVGLPRLATNFWPPMVGQTVQVEYDPKSHAVRFDKKDPALSSKRARTTGPDSFTATLTAAPGTPVQKTLLPSGYGLPQGMAAQLQQMLSTSPHASVVRLDLPDEAVSVLRSTLLRQAGNVMAQAASRPLRPQWETPRYEP